MLCIYAGRHCSINSMQCLLKNGYGTREARKMYATISPDHPGDRGAAELHVDTPGIVRIRIKNKGKVT